MIFNTVFMGSAAFILPIIEYLKHETNLIAIFTGQDQFQGRNRKEKVSPEAKKYAELNNIPYFQNIYYEDTLLFLKNNSIDLIIVASYGSILNSFILNIPKIYPLNIHFSLLPKYRGASPIQAALLNQEKKIGISIQIMNSKLDQGDIIYQKEIPILDEDDYLQLRDRLCLLSIEALGDVFLKIKNNKINRIPQKDIDASFCYKINKDDGHIKWEKKGNEIISQIKAYIEWPKSFFFYLNERVLIFKAKKMDTTSDYPPGTLIQFNKEGIYIQAKDSIISIIELQIEGKKRLSFKDFVNGYSWIPLTKIL